MENLIYWNNLAVGIDCGYYVSWFPSAPLKDEGFRKVFKIDKKAPL